MDLPICSFDLKSGMLCPRCEEKILRGLYDDLDIKVMKTFIELEKELPKLAKTGYVKTVEFADTIYIILKEDSLKYIDQETLYLLKKKLREKLGKKIKIIEDDKNVSRFIEKLVAPARIITINKIWLPDGSEEMRVILDRERSLQAASSVIEVVKKVKHITLRIDFEKTGWQERKVKISEKKPTS
ncbi:MAG: hypothetical protein QXF28_05635 [Nitrososphaerota archaeon]